MCIQQWIWPSKDRSLQALRRYLSSAICLTGVHILGLQTGTMQTLELNCSEPELRSFVIQKGLNLLPYKLWRCTAIHNLNLNEPIV